MLPTTSILMSNPQDFMPTGLRLQGFIRLHTQDGSATNEKANLSDSLRDRGRSPGLVGISGGGSHQSGRHESQAGRVWVYRV